MAGGGGQTTTVQKASPLEEVQARNAQLLAPVLMQHILGGLSGQPGPQQSLRTLNTQQQMRNMAGRMGVEKGSPRIGEAMRQSFEAQFKPDMDFLEMALNMYGGAPTTGGTTTQETDPGVMGTLTGVGQLGMGAASIYLMAKTLPLLAAGGSSEELKENITSLGPSLDKICSLRGAEFDWMATGEHDAGLIAEELEKVIPEARGYIGGFKVVKPLTIIGYLVECIKELRNEVEDLKCQIQK